MNNISPTNPNNVTSATNTRLRIINNNQNIIIQKTIEFVKSRLLKEGSGHDWWHSHRVYKIAKFLGEKENADIFVVQLAALLHDIADWKFFGNLEIGSNISKYFLKNLNVDEKAIEHVCLIIKTMSFKGQKTKSVMETIEGKVVQDADRLDAIGAIGIARTFAYGGYTKREIYNPEIKPKIYNDFEEYKQNTAPTINHFYEKLLLLKDLMNTCSAQKIAQKRHSFMETFLKEFFKEIE